MAIAFDGSFAPDTLPAMPCGGIPEFDDGSGFSYRCDQCGATVGSISMPPECQSMLDERSAKQAQAKAQIFTPEPKQALEKQSSFDVFF